MSNSSIIFLSLIALVMTLSIVTHFEISKIDKRIKVLENGK